MYLLAITLSLCAVYVGLVYLFPYFFEHRIARPGSISLVSIGILFVLSVAGYLVALSFEDLEWGNRVLHAFGGGFMAFLACFLAARDSKVEINKFQFFVFSALIVLALGVANEILELFLQNYAGMVFIRSADDTWLDLLSNVIGILIAGVLFTPFINKKMEGV